VYSPSVEDSGPWAKVLGTQHFLRFGLYRGTKWGTKQGMASVGPSAMARPSKPWFRESKGMWFCTLDGKKVSLGVQGRGNVKTAREAWHKLMAEGKAVLGPVEHTVGEIIKQFLADCDGKAKPKTLRGYQDFLLPFMEKHGKLPALTLAPTLAEKYSRKPEWCSSTRHDFLGTLEGGVQVGRTLPTHQTNPTDRLETPTEGQQRA
jgi:hypothetical protein